MNNSTPLTIHGHNMFDVSSMIQKSIRRGLIKDALYAAHEMMYCYRTYLWKRLLTVSAEDCNCLVTKIVNDLKNKDDVSHADSFISEAVCFLVEAKKNRDADFFVCNLFNNKKRIDIEEKITETLSTKSKCLTHNHHDVLICKNVFISSIKNGEFELAGYCGYELYLFHRPYFWKCLQEMSNEIGNNNIKKEISALRDVDLAQSKKSDLNQLFASKGIVILSKCFNGDFSPLKDTIHKSYGFDIIKDTKAEIPNYVYDCHTRLGRMRGKTTKMFIEEEQRALFPKEAGLFDNCKWDKFLDMLNSGFDNTMSAPPKPTKEAIGELMNGVVQKDLFS